MNTRAVDSMSSETDAPSVDMKLEIQIIPVSDVDRSKKFYEGLGWRLDADDAPFDGLRIVQFTPPGSATAVTFGVGLTSAIPGSAEAGLVVSDIEAAYESLVHRGVDVSDVWHGPPFPVEARQAGIDPEHTSYGSFCSFDDPDGNLWVVQEVTTRLPGRIDPSSIAFSSTGELENALRRAEVAHGKHEQATGQTDQNWPAWYAAFIVAEQAGVELPA